jgi:biopolymer transport protein ExbB
MIESLYLFEILYSIKEFIDKGGDVLIVIFIVSFIMLSIIFDKLYFNLFIYPKFIKKIQPKNRYWNRKKFLQIKDSLEDSMSLLKITIVVLPLLGLLGTVIGMIDVFDTISILGNSDARAISNGISQATISTMVGMSMAIIGMIFRVYIEQSNKKRLRVLSEKLQLQNKRRGK